MLVVLVVVLVSVQSEKRACSATREPDTRVHKIARCARSSVFDVPAPVVHRRVRTFVCWMCECELMCVCYLRCTNAVLHIVYHTVGMFVHMYVACVSPAALMCAHLCRVCAADSGTNACKNVALSFACTRARDWARFCFFDSFLRLFICSVLCLCI